MEFMYKPDQSEIKLMLLYAINSLNTEATYTLLDFVVKDSAHINYFELQKYVEMLVDTGDLKEIKTSENAIIYSLTNTGEETLKFFSDKIPFSIREALDKKIFEINKNQKSANEIRADFFAISKDEYAVKFLVKEKGVTLLNMEVYAGSRERAKKLASTINENPDSFFTGLNKYINKDIDN